MNFLKPLLIVAAAACVVQYWHNHHAVNSSALAADAHGFVRMPPVEGQNPDTVYVVAAPSCAPPAVQRAAKLAQDLIDEGIPVVRAHSVTFVPVGLVALNDSGVNRVLSILGAGDPVVFVHGRAKAAANLDEVEAEYGGSGRQGGL